MAKDKRQQNFLDQVQMYLEQNSSLGSPEQREAILTSLETAITGANAFSSQVDTIFEDLKGTEYSADKITDFVYNYYRSLDPTEMHYKLSNSWPDGIEKPIRPTDEELEARKERLAETNRMLMNSTKEKNLATNFKMDFSEKNFPSTITTRNFKAFMLVQKADAVEKNKEVYEAFISGDKDKIKAAVNEVYDRYLADEKIFDKKYSDKELVDNWPKLGQICTGLGMEYESFQKGLKELGITMDPGKQKRLDSMFAKAYAFNNVNKTRVGYLSTGLSMFGDSKQFNQKEVASALKMSGDTELSKGTKAAQLEKNVSAIGYGNYALRTVFNDKDDIELIVDEGGKKYDLEKVNVLGEALMEGKQLRYIKKSELKVHVLSPNEDGFPMEPKDEAKVPKTPQERDNLFNMKMELLEKSNEPQAMKDIRENVLYNQYKIALICANPKSPTFEKDFKEASISLAAAVTIQQMAETTEPTPEVLKGLASDKTFKSFTKDLKAAGYGEQMAKLFKDDPSAITEMGQKELFEKVTEVERELNKVPEKAKVNDAPKKEAQTGPMM